LAGFSPSDLIPPSEGFPPPRDSPGAKFPLLKLPGETPGKKGPPCQNPLSAIIVDTTGKDSWMKALFWDNCQTYLVTPGAKTQQIKVTMILG